MVHTLGKHLKARGRPMLAWLILAAVIAVPALLQSTTQPAGAIQAKRNILPKSEGSAARDPDFDDYAEDFPMPGSCGSKNINGGFNFARWTVKSSYGNGSTVWVGDEWTVSVFVNQRWGATSHGNNGPDPINLEMKPTGPVINGAAPEGEVPNVNQVGEGDIAYEDYSAVGVHTAIGAWGYGFDGNSSPGVFDLSDGVSVKLTIHMKATAEGVVTLPKLKISGYDGTTPAGPIGCEMNIGWTWTVARPLSPVGVSDSAKVNASYTDSVAEDASNGSHRIRIPVLANDDDPNIAGGPGNVDQVGISDWSAQSAHGGQVKCGTFKNAGPQIAFEDLGHSCEYQPKQGYSGPDTFNYRLRQKSDELEKIIPVNITVLANTAPTAADAHFSTDQGEDKDFDLAPYADDPENDPIMCPSTIVGGVNPAVGTVTINPDCTFHWNNTSPAFSGDVTFTYRVCDTHPTLTMAQMGTNIVKLDGFADGDLNGQSTRRCRNADATINVKALQVAIVIPPKGVTDVDVVDAGYQDDGIGRYTVRIPVLQNDTDGNGPKPTSATAKLQIKTYPPISQGFPAVKAGGIIEFSPTDGYSGPVSFTYKVCEDPTTQNPPYDGDPICGSGIVKIDVRGNEAPDAAPDEYQMESDQLLVGAPLAANDSDGDGEALACKTGAVSVSDPAKVETVNVSANCSLSFNPVDDATGSVDIGYRICDDHKLAFPLWPADPYGTDGRSTGDAASRCSVGTATIKLLAPAVDPPEVIDPLPECGADVAVTTKGTKVVIDVLANDTDVNSENQPSALYLPGPTADEPLPTKTGASVQLAADPTKLEYTPTADFEGEDGFDYVAVDTAGQQCIGKVVVTVGPDGPGTTTTTQPGSTTTTSQPGSTTTSTTQPGSTTTTSQPGTTTTTQPGSTTTTSQPGTTTTTTEPGSTTTTQPQEQGTTTTTQPLEETTTTTQAGDGGTGTTTTTDPNATTTTTADPNGGGTGDGTGDGDGGTAAGVGTTNGANGGTGTGVSATGATTTVTGSLPVTGSDIVGLVVGGLALIVVGAVALGGARRRG